MNDQLAFVFPGQGSQKIGMLSELRATYQEIDQTLAEASEHLGFDVIALISDGPEATLNQTQYTQPVLLACSIALWRLWTAHSSVLPKFVAGHSLGEYSALVAAGVMEFSCALKTVQKRGEYMEQAVPKGQGAMAAIVGLDDDVVATICQSVAIKGQVVEPVNYNSPGQIAIAGHSEAVVLAVAQCKEQGAKLATLLPVSGPFHSQLMQQAAEKLAIQLEQIHCARPEQCVIQNVHAQIVDDVVKLKENLVLQVYKPVQWVNTILTMQNQGVTTIIECGPGNVLSGLNKRIARSIVSIPLSAPAKLSSALSQFNAS